MEKKPNTKHFLSKQDKQNLIFLYQKGFKFREIAKKIGSTTRQVKEHIRRYENKIVNKFSPEEDAIIISKYQEGITKEWQLLQFIPTKEPYMIRNRIKSLIRKGLINNDLVVPMKSFQLVNPVNDSGYQSLDLPVLHPLEFPDPMFEIDGCQYGQEDFVVDTYIDTPHIEES